MTNKYPNVTTKWKPHLKLVRGEWLVYVGAYCNWPLVSKAMTYAREMTKRR